MSDTTMRPEDATHRDSGGNLYKAGDELNWLRWGNDEWFIYGTVPAGTLRPLKDRPSTIRPEGATHYAKIGNDYYKPMGIGEGWMRWYGGGSGWLPVGDMPAEGLTLLAPVQVVELEKFDAHMAPRSSTACEDTFCVSERLIGSKFCLIHGAAPAPQLPTMPEPGVPFIHYFTKYQFVGSRVTCNPPPLDTDQDVLVLVHQSNHAVMERKILEAGFVKEGSLPAEMALDADKNNVFHSYRKGDMNYIVTTDEAFYQRFSTATELARKYNLMEKSDRIQLFQAVLYGKWWA